MKMHFSIPDTQELNEGNGSTFIVSFYYLMFSNILNVLLFEGL